MRVLVLGVALGPAGLVLSGAAAAANRRPRPFRPLHGGQDLPRAEGHGCCSGSEGGRGRGARLPAKWRERRGGADVLGPPSGREDASFRASREPGARGSRLGARRSAARSRRPAAPRLPKPRPEPPPRTVLPESAGGGRRALKSALRPRRPRWLRPDSGGGFPAAPPPESLGRGVPGGGSGRFLSLCALRFSSSPFYVFLLQRELMAWVTLDSAEVKPLVHTHTRTHARTHAHTQLRGCCCAWVCSPATPASRRPDTARKILAGSSSSWSLAGFWKSPSKATKSGQGQESKTPCLAPSAVTL